MLGTSNNVFLCCENITVVENISSNINDGYFRMNESYSLIKSNVPPTTNVTLWFWIDVPPVYAGSYNGTIYDLDNYTLRNWNTTLSGLSNESEYNLTIYANDTSNNQNTKSVQYYVDNLAPRYSNAQAVPDPTNVSVAVKCSIYLNDTFEFSSVKISENSLGSYTELKE